MHHYLFMINKKRLFFLNCKKFDFTTFHSPVLGQEFWLLWHYYYSCVWMFLIEKKWDTTRQMKLGSKSISSGGFHKGSLAYGTFL